MKISTRLRLAVYVPAFMALAIIVALVFSYQEMQGIQRNGDTIRQVRSGITELNHSVFSYTLYHEERPKQQFMAQHGALIELIDSTQGLNPDQQRLLGSIREDSVAMKDLFLQLASAFERAAAGEVVGPAGTEDRLAGLLLFKSYEADLSAATLRELIDHGIGITQVRIIGLILLVLLLATVPLTVLLIRTRRGIISSISSLSEGAAVIGSGDLDFRISEDSSDEIGDLSRAFNRMTARLKTVTASKADLEKEIEERERAEEELRQRSAELETSNKELEAFSYSVSHDLRAPLRSMEGFSSALLEDYAGKLDDEGKQYLRYIQDSSDLMGRLIDDLLRLSRVTRSDMNRVKVNLSEMAARILDDLQKAEPERTAAFSVAPDVTVYADRNLLRLALENLLGNAWKFSGKTASTRIELGAVMHDGKQAYFVRDHGVGFDMAYVDKLFKPFERLHRASDFAGTGIGLATVARIIHRHGGQVWAESQVGEGATFYFTLG